jgi:uncharacterized protein DUF3168
MANEPQAAEKWIFSTLSGNAAVTALVAQRVFAGMAPQTAARPFIVYVHNRGSYRATVGGQSRIFGRPVYAVKAVTEGGSFALADQIVDALDTALVGTSSTVAAGGITWQVSCVRIGDIRYVEVREGQRFNHAGGLYDLYIHRV